MSDPIVDEVRRYRLEHTRKLKGDLTAIQKDLQEIQRQSGHKVVRLPPRKLTRSTGAVR
jgi:hypothetical protein